MKFFKAKYVKSPRKYLVEWDAAIEAYKESFAKIWPRLPESVRTFEEHAKRHMLHDAAVNGIAWHGSKELHVDIDYRRLEFVGVQSVQMPEELTEWTVWLYDEIHLAPHNAFELRALFDTGEFRVVVEEIRVDDKLLKRYVVPEEPPAPPPTLFLDRQQRHSGKRKR